MLISHKKLLNEIFEIIYLMKKRFVRYLNCTHLLLRQVWVSKTAQCEDYHSPTRKVHRGV